MNGLLLEIKMNCIEELSLREEQYNLIKTDYQYFCPITWKIIWNWEDAFILIAKENHTVTQWKPFLPYHNNVINWAYSIWDSFWKLFELSTYYL